MVATSLCSNRRYADGWDDHLHHNFWKWNVHAQCNNWCSSTKDWIDSQQPWNHGHASIQWCFNIVCWFTRHVLNRCWSASVRHRKPAIWKRSTSLRVAIGQHPRFRVLKRPRLRGYAKRYWPMEHLGQRLG